MSAGVNNEALLEWRVPRSRAPPPVEVQPLRLVEVRVPPVRRAAGSNLACLLWLSLYSFFFRTSSGIRCIFFSLFGALSSSPGECRGVCVRGEVQRRHTLDVDEGNEMGHGSMGDVSS